MGISKRVQALERAINRGYRDYFNGKRLEDNPYKMTKDGLGRAWHIGWFDAKKDMQNKGE